MDTVVNYEKLTLLNFSALWCQPCQMLDKELDEVEVEMKELISIKRIDVDAEKEVAARMGISSVPALVLIDGDKVVSQAVGYMHTESIMDWIDKYI